MPEGARLATERLQKLAREKRGRFTTYKLADPLGMLVRIEWWTADRVLYGGEGKGATAEAAAAQLLERLQGAGLADCALPCAGHDQEAG